MKFRHLPPAGQFKKTLFCWIDILGFSDLVESSTDPNEVLSLLTCLDFSGFADFSVAIERRIISDTIILWSEDVNALYPFFNIAALCQSSLIKKGFLLKGVIGYGDHFHDRVSVHDTDTKGVTFSDDIVVSKILIECMKEEKRLATPVVKVLPQAFNFIAQNRQAWPWFQQLWAVEGDACVVSRYFGASELNIFKGITSKRQGDTFDEGALIEANIDSAIIQLKEIRKYVAVGVTLDAPRKKYWDYMANSLNSYLDSAAVVHKANRTLLVQIDKIRL